MLDSLDTLIAFVLIMLVVSLLITIAVQAASAVLNLHGLNLARGLKTTLAVIVPETVDAKSESNAGDLTNYIIKGQFLSDSFLPDWKIFRGWRHATAIRPSEVFDAIQRIAIAKEPVGDQPHLREVARNVLVSLGVDGGVIDSAAQEISAVRAATEHLGDDALTLLPDAQRARVQAALDAVGNRLNAASQAMGMRAVEARQAFDDARKKFTEWSCSCQERAQQWFTMHTRILTIIFAFLAAFGLQLDTVEIFKLVSTNRLVREKLVAETSAVTAQAEKILGDNQGVLKQALDEWRKGLKDENARQATASIEVTPSLSRGQLHSNVDQALTNSQIPNKNGLLADLDKAIDAAALHNLEVNAQAYRQVRSDLDQTGFNLFVDEPGWRWHHGWASDFGPHFLGMLFSAALLSLGAPFWYNSLKNLTSLRSAVAQSISEEKDAAAKRGLTDQRVEP
jgi:hypothetical protein